ncbi:MAG: hypothetical protein ACI9QD_000525 [Thermoproteota archaeon]|jgi:hypothetical protein
MKLNSSYFSRAFFFLFLFSCSEKDSAHHLKFDMDNLYSLTSIINNKRFFINKSKQGVSPFKFIVLESKLKKMISNISDLKYIEGESLNLRNLKPKVITISSHADHMLIEGFENDKGYYIKLKIREEGGKPSYSAGLVSEQSFKSIFSELSSLRPYRVSVIRDFESIHYLANKKKLSNKQSESLTKILKAIKVDHYIYNGKPNKDIMKKFKINAAINENLKDGFEFKLKGKSYYVYLARPEIMTSKIRIYSSIEESILEGTTKQWLELKNLEKELL